MESAFCAGVKEIGGDIEPPPPRSPFERDPAVTEEGEAWSGMHELRKSAQFPNPQFGFGVGEPPKEEQEKHMQTLQRVLVAIFRIFNKYLGQRAYCLRRRAVLMLKESLTM